MQPHAIRTITRKTPPACWKMVVNGMLDPDCDLTFVGNQDSPWNKAHSMSVNGNFDGSVGVDWLSITDCHSIARARCAFEEVKHAVRDCSKYARVAKIGAKETQRMGRLHTGPW